MSGGGIPQTPFDVRRRIATERSGFRMAQLPAFVSSYIAEHGYSPSLSTIRDALGFCDVRNVRRCVDRCVLYGLLEKGQPPKGGRGKRGDGMVRLPC